MGSQARAAANVLSDCCFCFLFFSWHSLTVHPCLRSLCLLMLPLKTPTCLMRWRHSRLRNRARLVVSLQHLSNRSNDFCSRWKECVHLVIWLLTARFTTFFAYIETCKPKRSKWRVSRQRDSILNLTRLRKCGSFPELWPRKTLLFTRLWRLIY